MNYFRFFLAAAFLLAASAFAEEDQYRLESVTVTAEKRKQDAQKVSIPMNVFSEAALEDMELSSVSDLSLYLPNIFASEGDMLGDTEIVFRGLASSVYAYTNSLVLVVDGLTVDSQKALDISFEDVERIEFLRGPQGTLYGKNAAAGVISITTRQPGNETTGRVSFAAEEESTYDTSFRISGPIREDLLFYGLSASYRTTDGWMTDHTPGGMEHMNEQEDKYLSLKLRYTPGRGNDISLRYSRSELDGGSPPTVIGKDFSYDTVTGMDEYGADHTSDTLGLRMEFERSAFTLTSVTSYLDNSKEDIVYAGSPVYDHAYFNEDLLQISQELRLSSPASSKVMWLAGIYADRTVDDWTDGGSGMVMDLSMYSMGLMDLNYSNKQTADTAAAFGEITFPLYKDKLSLTLGARYEQVKKELNTDYSVYDYTSGIEMPFDYTGQPVPIEYTLEDTWSVFLGKAALSYQASENLRYYLSAAQGYIPGGYNWMSTDPDTSKYDETHSVDFELGMKSSWLDNRLNLNINFFYTDYRDLQTYQQTGIGIYEVVSAGEAHAQGFELDAAARPAPGWDIYGSLGYLDTEYDDYEAYNSGTASMENYSGNTITMSPEITASAGIKYRHPSGVFAMGEYSHTGRTYFTYGNESDYTRDSYNILNAKIGYESGMGFEVYAYVKNLADEEYFTHIIEMEPQGKYVVGQPRTFGVQAAYRF